MLLIGFSLERALKHSHSVVTRSGHRAKIVAVLAGNIPAPVLVELSIVRDSETISSSRGTSGGLENYYKDGKYLPPMDHPLDLFISQMWIE